MPIYQPKISAEPEKLIDKIKNLQGLTNDEKADLLGLLRSFKKYGLVWEEKFEEVEERLREEIPVLVEEFCNYYAHHQNKTVVYYYDTTALGANYAVNEQDFHWVVCHEFEKRGWQVEDVYLGNPMRHDEKYLLINQGFAGKQRLMPFFNRQNNDDLILAIQTAGVVRGRNGFRKDKGGEKLDETEENLLEHRTDGTDAFDTLYIGAEKFPYIEIFPVSASGVL